MPRGKWRGKPAQNSFWYPGRLKSETTCDLFDPQRFRVKGSNVDYIIGKQYERYIEQSSKSNRWKTLAYNWIKKESEPHTFHRRNHE